MSTDWPAPEENWPKRGSSGNGSGIAYFVEARSPSSMPAKIGDQIYDTRWRRVEFQHSVIGVPSTHSYDRGAQLCNLLSYEAAQALRWWLHTVASAEVGISNLETRIVKCKTTYSFSYEAVSAHSVIGPDDRSSMMPDWGSKPASPHSTHREASAL